MVKYNGEKLELALMAGHIQMHNWDAIQRQQSRAKLWDRIAFNCAFWLVISLMALLLVR